ncbi:MAG TPA: SPOR domain-containing protein [Afifellaceae bacterium]|nr:SPOR domain-containing protein [Afifellaceae bacterium]
MIELARIVAEDGGFRRHRAPELRPARNETGRRDALNREESIASQLEAELLQSWEADDRGEDPVRQRAVAEMPAAPAPAPVQFQPAPVPLRPAPGAAPRQPEAFPEIVIDDARPHRASQTGQSEHRHQPEAHRREAVREAFEEELSALFAETEPAPAAGAFHLPASEAGDSLPMAENDKPYEDSYSVEVHDFEAAHEFDPEPDELYEDEEASEFAPVQAEPARRRRSYKGLVAAMGVLGVVVFGGGVAALVGGMGSPTDAGPPPVIRAEAGPAKVEPEQTAEAQTGDSAGQAVYDRVAGRAPKDDEKLVDRAEEPRQVSRVVLPQGGDASEPQEASAADGGEADDRLAGAAAEAQPDSRSSEERIGGSISSETPSMQSGPRIDPVGPRRVRTVSVRPDGSVASAPAPVRVAEAAPQSEGEVQADFAAAAGPDPVPVRTIRIEGDSAGSPRTLQEQDQPSDAQSAAAPQPLVPLAEGPPSAAAGADNGGAEAAAGVDLTQPAPPAEVQVAMLPRAKPDQVPAAFLRRAAVQRPEPQRNNAPPAAAARSGEPVNLLAGPAAPRAQPAQAAQPRQPAASPAASSPYAVQLSAQRSEDQARATFASLRSRFPSILGSQQPLIERADLGDRGIYYRVRVGAGSQTEASRLCEQLKAAGGSCFVTR